MPQNGGSRGLLRVSKGVQKRVVLGMSTIITFLSSISPEAWAAFLALGFSLYTFIEQKRGQTRLRLLESLQSNGTMLNEAWKQLATTPSALQFHSIDEKKLQSAGLTVGDLVYLLINFQAADHYYQHKDRKKGMFSNKTLRYAILENPKTRKAWPFVKPFFIGSARYVKKIEATIAFFEEVAQAEQQRKSKLSRP